MFGVVNFILCGFNHTCGLGVNIVAVGGINCVGRLSGNDETVDGGKYSGVHPFSEEP